jgi:hypothetical protein
LSVVWSASSLQGLKSGLLLSDIWPQAHSFLAGEPGYFTLFCDYGGLTAYTLAANSHGSVCLEHGF